MHACRRIPTPEMHQTPCKKPQMKITERNDRNTKHKTSTTQKKTKKSDQPADSKDRSSHRSKMPVADYHSSPSSNPSESRSRRHPLPTSPALGNSIHRPCSPSCRIRGRHYTRSGTYSTST
ncbi:hypothetical protein ABW21_db0201859 [Orbilia brochopaga]|nr:hypothetical protein ABW21_db0201859 [Drechslerella brochopaga]